jgi:hypothetical protein
MVGVVNDVEVNAAVRLIAGTDSVYADLLCESWIWTESHPEMPWVKKRSRQYAEAVRVVASLLEGNPVPIEAMLAATNHSPCNMAWVMRGGQAD